MGQARADARVVQTALAIVNGALAGQGPSKWESPSAANYDRIRDRHLAPKGLTEAQVQIVWLQQGVSGLASSLPAPDAEAFGLEMRFGNTVRALKLRYANLKIVFFSNLPYAGYASTGNGEPFSYEIGLAMKWLIGAQIAQMDGAPPDPIAGDLDYDSIAPWLSWGPELWADGLTPRSDGLTWACGDFANDGLHPSMAGEEKVATRLLDFMFDSPFSAAWFRADGEQAIPGLSRKGRVVLALGLLGVALVLTTRRISMKVS